MDRHKREKFLGENYGNEDRSDKSETEDEISKNGFLETQVLKNKKNRFRRIMKKNPARNQIHKHVRFANESYKNENESDESKIEDDISENSGTEFNSSTNKLIESSGIEDDISENSDRENNASFLYPISLNNESFKIEKRIFARDQIHKHVRFADRRNENVSDESETKGDSSENSDTEFNSSINKLSKSKNRKIVKNESDSSEVDDILEHSDTKTNTSFLTEDNSSENSDTEFNSSTNKLSKSKNRKIVKNESDSSEVEDDISEHSDTKTNTSFLYSKNLKNESLEIEKGMAVRDQIRTWETLLESRIILQRCLVATNKLPKPINFEQIWTQCSQEEKNTITEHRENLWDLLEKLIQLQHGLRKQCSEYMETISNEKTSHVENVDTATSKIKRRKLTEYPQILEKQYNEYATFRNSTIQKWNDRTKIASGKFAKSNFSAFDQPILKQIEHIMSDKHRLIQRTFVKRSQYHIIGEEDLKTDEKSSEENSSCDTDKEIFDDDDFYHKLLRDYIERKTIDVSDPTQLGRKWIKLQSLRNKMKRKIDTRRTKERKIKFDVHTKLINFMAPITVDRWDDTAINELHNSVFGKNLLNT